MITKLGHCASRPFDAVMFGSGVENSFTEEWKDNILELLKGGENIFFIHHYLKKSNYSLHQQELIDL